jgi:hypothetical protein
MPRYGRTFDQVFNLLIDIDGNMLSNLQDIAISHQKHTRKEGDRVASDCHFFLGANLARNQKFGKIISSQQRSLPSRKFHPGTLRRDVFLPSMLQSFIG